MVEFSNTTNYSYILNNESFLNQTYNYSPKKKLSFTFKDFVLLIIDFLMIIGPSIGYFLQSLKFKQTKSSKGFSKSLCLIIYFSQVLRVFFWIGKPFKITLLYQSILIIIFQIYLIHLWVKYHGIKKPEKKGNQENDLNFYENKQIIEYLIDWSDTISPNKIWNWTSQIEYFKFMSLIVFFLLIISGVLGIHNVFLTNIYGTISVLAEVLTLIPQIIVSCKTKNSGNLSTSMVALWAIGDSCKFVYNIIYKSPIQMIVSGGFQIFLDFFCLIQILCYKDKKKLNKNDNTKVEISSNIKVIQEKKHDMNILGQRLNPDPVQKNGEEFNKDNNNNVNNSNNVNSENNNKVEAMDSFENSDKVEVLDKSRDDHIKYTSDDEDQNNDKNPHHELHEEVNVDKIDNNQNKGNEIGN